MDNVATQFHSLITSEDSVQALLLCECDINTSFNGNYYLSLDGDMTSDGATFSDDMTQGEEYALGCVTCRTMNVDLMNLDGYLNNHNFGWVQAYIGVVYASSTYTPRSGENCRMVYNNTFYGMEDGFYDSTTKVQSGNCVSLYSMTDGYVYFAMEDGDSISVYKYKTSDSSVVSVTFNDAMLAKFSKRRGIRINGNGYFYIYENGSTESYLCTCLGHFNVDRPKKTVCDVIRITDAFDPIHLLDTNASYQNYDISTGYNALNVCAYMCGLTLSCENEVVENRLRKLAIDRDKLLNNAYTFRRVASFICEAIGCNARLVPKTKRLLIYVPNRQTLPTAYPITASMIDANGIEVQDFSTHPIECVAVTSLENDATLYPQGGGDYTYEFNGNPFVDRASAQLLSYVRQMPIFTPMVVNIISADPSFQTGDIVKISCTYGEEENLSTFDGEDVTTYSGEKIEVIPSIGVWTIPIMSQTLHFNGRCYATYEARATEDRSGTTYDIDYTDTNARTSKYLPSDYIIWSDKYNPIEEFLASDVSLSAQTTATTDVLSITVGAGMWVIVGQVEFSAVASRKVVNISDTAGQYYTNIARNDSHTDSSQVTAVQAVALVHPSVTKTYYLNCASSSACKANANRTCIRAFRIL